MKALDQRKPALDLRGIRHSYDGTSDALSSVDLRVESGESVAVLGRSGSGKSTLIAIAALLLQPTAGSVSIKGIDCSRAPERELTRLRRDHIGFVFQTSNLLEDQPIWKSIALPLRLQGKGPRRCRPLVRSAIGAVELDGLEERAPHQLSVGQRHRVAIARALVTAPPLLIADEPTASLDEQTGDTIAELLIRDANARGSAVVLATHDHRLAQLADRRVVLKRGSLEHASAAEKHPVR
jgi:putative ABC transport system ATP-binding protein